MKTWSDSPFRPVVGPDEVPEGRVLSEDDGESKQVHEIAGRPGWLAKLYKNPLPESSAATLQRLVYLPTVMSRRDQAVVDSCVAWPVARIVDGGRVLGVVMAKAPDHFFVRLLKQFSGVLGEESPLVLDWLVHTDEACAKRGIEPAGVQVRKRAMGELLAVGSLFASHGLVYADWSYSNVFWEQGTGATFVIDMDTCGMGSREWIESHSWEDPLFPETDKRPLTVYSDRYKLAVLTARCLTGERKDPLAAHRALERQFGVTPLSAAVERALTARSPEDRPAPDELLAALDGSLGETRIAVPSGASSGNVIGTIPVGRPSAPEEPSSRGNVVGAVDLRGRTPDTTPVPAPDVSPAPVPQPATDNPDPAGPVAPSTPAPAPAPVAPSTPAPAPTPASTRARAPARTRARTGTPRRGPFASAVRLGTFLLVLYLIARSVLGWLP